MRRSRARTRIAAAACRAASPEEHSGRGRDGGQYECAGGNVVVGPEGKLADDLCGMRS